MAGRKTTPRTYGAQIPDFSKLKKDSKNFRSEFWGIFNYAHYELSSSELKKESLKFLKTIKSPNYEKAKELHENRFVSIGKFCYILNHGGDVIDDAEKKIDDRVGSMIRVEENEKKKEAISIQVAKIAISVPTIQDRLREKAREVAAEIDGWIDDFALDKKLPVKEIADFTKLFNQFDLKAGHIRYLLSYFDKAKAEIEEVIVTKDAELREAYSHYSKPDLRKVGLFFNNLYAAGDMIQQTAAVVRKPRKKKPIDITKLASKLKYKKEDVPYGLVSVNPVNIPGSKEVWIYNTKNRKLGCFKAADKDGLNIKGAGLVNFSADSVEKTLRKPVETLAEFKAANKVKLRTFLKDLTTIDTPLKGKINEFCIILKIEK